MKHLLGAIALIVLILNGCGISQMGIADVYDLNRTMNEFSESSDFFIVEAYQPASNRILIVEDGMNWPAHVRLVDGKELLLDAFDIDDDGILELFLPKELGWGARVIFRSHDGLVRFSCSDYTALYSPEDITEEEWNNACVVTLDNNNVELVAAGSPRYMAVQEEFRKKFHVSEEVLEAMAGEIRAETAEKVLRPLVAIIDVAMIVSSGFSAYALFNPSLYSDLTLKYLWATAWTTTAVKSGIYSFGLYPSYWHGHLGSATPTGWKVHDMMDRYMQYYHPDLVH